MCTALNSTKRGHFFGRTLDVECYAPTQVVAVGRFYPFCFSCGEVMKNHLSILGAAHVSGGVPLFYDGMNEAGLCCAALSFPPAVYFKEGGGFNLASYEIISYILSRFRTVREARAHLGNLRITDKSFSSDLPTTPLHWICADRTGAFVIEQTEGGLKIYDAPHGILANAPEYPFHLHRIREIAQLSNLEAEGRLCDGELAAPYSSGFGALGLPGDYSSSSRFLRVAFVESFCLPFEGHGGVDRFFTVMDTVKLPYGCVIGKGGSPNYTVYTCCMDTEAGVYHYSLYEDGKRRNVSFSSFSLDTDKLFSLPM